MDGGTHFERRARAAMILMNAVESVFARIAADFDQPGVKARAAIPRKRERAADMNHTDGIVRLLIVDDSVARQDFHFGPCARHASIGPRGRRRPRTATPRRD